MTDPNTAASHEHTYWFREFYIPDRMMDSIKRYLENGIRPGSFLSAVICNDLQEAVGRADEENMRNLPAYVAYFCNEVPRDCWGSWEAMIYWMKKRKCSA